MTKRTGSLMVAVAAWVFGGVVDLAAADVSDAFGKHCVSCHGKDGRGRTKAGRMAKVKDFTDAEYQASFTDEDAFKSIKEGMKRDGKELMKPFGDKLNDTEIKGLVAFVRDFKKE